VSSSEMTHSEFKLNAAAAKKKKLKGTRGVSVSVAKVVVFFFVFLNYFALFSVQNPSD
jgi:hypothetical protein